MEINVVFKLVALRHSYVLRKVSGQNSAWVYKKEMAKVRQSQDGNQLL
jgi:hypothetical protein